MRSERRLAKDSAKTDYGITITDTRIITTPVEALRLYFSIGYRGVRWSIYITVQNGAQLIHANLMHRSIAHHGQMVID